MILTSEEYNVLFFGAVALIAAWMFRLMAQLLYLMELRFALHHEDIVRVDEFAALELGNGVSRRNVGRLFQHLAPRPVPLSVVENPFVFDKSSFALNWAGTAAPALEHARGFVPRSHPVAFSFSLQQAPQTVGVELYWGVRRSAIESLIRVSFSDLDRSKEEMQIAREAMRQPARSDFLRPRRIPLFPSFELLIQPPEELETVVDVVQRWNVRTARVSAGARRAGERGSRLLRGGRNGRNRRARVARRGTESEEHEGVELIDTSAAQEAAQEAVQEEAQEGGLAIGSGPGAGVDQPEAEGETEDLGSERRAEGDERERERETGEDAGDWGDAYVGDDVAGAAAVDDAGDSYPRAMQARSGLWDVLQNAASWLPGWSYASILLSRFSFWHTMRNLRRVERSVAAAMGEDGAPDEVDAERAEAGVMEPEPVLEHRALFERGSFDERTDLGQFVVGQEGRRFSSTPSSSSSGARTDQTTYPPPVGPFLHPFYTSWGVETERMPLVIVAYNMQHRDAPRYLAPGHAKGVVPEIAPDSLGLHELEHDAESPVQQELERSPPAGPWLERVRSGALRKLASPSRPGIENVGAADILCVVVLVYFTADTPSGLLSPQADRARVGGAGGEDGSVSSAELPQVTGKEEAQEFPDLADDASVPLEYSVEGSEELRQPGVEQHGEADEGAELLREADGGTAAVRMPRAVLYRQFLCTTGFKFVEVQDVFGFEEGSECVVCLTEPKDTTLLPCRHFCVCHECFEKLRAKCPVCRAEVSDLVQFDIRGLAGTHNKAQ